jgi:hypothetical protein
MLVQLTPNVQEIARRFEVLEKEREKIGIPSDFVYLPQTDDAWIIEPGIYKSNFAYNFSEEECEETLVSPNSKYQSIMLKGVLNMSKEDQEFIENYEWVDSYGVADSVEQIKEHYAKLIHDPNRKYIIALTIVTQDISNKGKGGGWRWHKWGEYIGTLDRKCEYLDDEDFGPEFPGYVLVFDIYEIEQ